MAKKKEVEKIRVHNQGKREFLIPPTKEGKKNRMLYPNRAIEIEKDLALKLIKSYPRDLIEFDSLVTGEKKDLNRENARLESEVETLRQRIAELEQANDTKESDPAKEEPDKPPEKKSAKPGRPPKNPEKQD